MEKIYTLNNNEIIIAPTTGCYLLKPEENKIVTINSDFLTIKGIIIKNKKIFIAQTNCIIRYGTKDSFINESSLLKVLNIKRCYSLSLNSSTNQIFVAFSNGLHELTKDSIFTPVLYNNEVITASSLLYINNKTYATTFNNGLFIIDKMELEGNQLKMACCLIKF